MESPEWITVIPWYRNEEGKAMFVMEQQFRHGSATVTREFPAGLVEKGEDPKVAAARELLEETGSKAEKLEEIAQNRGDRTGHPCGVPASSGGSVHTADCR